MVILFNIKKLAKKLAHNELRETHKLIYLIVPLLMLQFHLTDLSLSPTQQAGWLSVAQMMNMILVSLLIAAGVCRAWLVNRQGDQKNFLERFICLSFPILAYLFIATLIVQYTASLLLRGAVDLPEGYAVGALLFYDATVIIYFLSLSHWIKKVSHQLA